MVDSSEEHRHRCEVRQILRWRQERGRAWVHDFINGREVTLPSGRKTWERKGIRQTRGDAAADRILADCAQQWGLGNDGTGGRWLSAGAQWLSDDGAAAAS